MNECTTRGIIIQYDKEIQLFETEIDSEINYYILSEKKTSCKRFYTSLSIFKFY